MDIITGVRGTDALVAANIQPDIDRQLLKIDAYQYPLSSWLFLSKKRSKVCNNAYGKFSHFEKEALQHLAKVTANITASTTLTLTSSNVDSKAQFNLDDYVQIEETGEMAYVSSVTGGGGTDVVLTNIEGGSLTSVSSDTYLRIIGNRNFEYGGRKSAKTVKEVEYYNYCNIFKYYINTSGRQQAGKYYTDGQTHDELVEQRLKEARAEIERYFWFAPKRGYATSGNERATYGMGIEARITTNVSSYQGALTEPILRSYLKNVFRRSGNLGSNRKIHFCGEDQMDDIEKMFKDKYQLEQSPGDANAVFKEIGLGVKSYRMFAGVVSFVYNPIFDGKYKSYGFTLDEETVLLRHMGNDKHGSRKFRRRATQDPDIDGEETEMLFDVGIQLKGEMMSGKLYGTN